MDIIVKAIIAALLATIFVIGGGRAMLKTNELRNYPSLRPNVGSANGQPGPAGTSSNTPAASVNSNVAGAGGNGPMSKGEEAAAESGFSTELENPNN
jgi:hypothetical protein